MRTFYGIDSANRSKASETGTTSVDGLSCIFSSSVLSGTVKNSLLSNVRCNHIDVDGCVLINVTANSIVAKQGCIVYNIADGSADGINITEKVVLAGVFSEDGTHKRMESSTDIDGGKYKTRIMYYMYIIVTRMLHYSDREIKKLEKRERKDEKYTPLSIIIMILMFLCQTLEHTHLLNLIPFFYVM